MREADWQGFPCVVGFRHSRRGFRSAAGPASRDRVGVRRDIHDSLSETARESLFLPMRNQRVRVRDVLDGMPRLRSGLSRKPTAGRHGRAFWRGPRPPLLPLGSDGRTYGGADRSTAGGIRRHSEGAASTLPRKALKPAGIGEECPADLKNWITSPTITSLANNETRSHMASDLSRYLFAALHGEIMGRSPKASDYPPSLAPDHRNWDSGKFADRFRVQLFDSPSTTGYQSYRKRWPLLHSSDPTQCRSLTVREAARLQTFPDDYYFKGNRTEQFTQVGNAVPPFLAKQIGEVLYSALASTLSLKESVSKRQEDKKQIGAMVGRHGRLSVPFRSPSPRFQTIMRSFRRPLAPPSSSRACAISAIRWKRRWRMSSTTPLQRVRGTSGFLLTRAGPSPGSASSTTERDG